MPEKAKQDGDGTQMVVRKDIEIEKLPEGWRLTRLGEFFRISSLKVKKYLISDENESEIPILSMTRYNGLILQQEKFGKRVASKDIGNYKIIKKGQIAQGFPMDEGVIYALKRFELGAISPVYLVWEIFSLNVDIDFIDIYLKTPKMITIYRSLCSNTVHRRRIVNEKDFKNIQIPLPPLSEQKNIAAVLSSLQETIEKTENVIASLREFKKAMMRHLFTYGPVSLDQSEQVKLKETEIGMMPEEWEVVKLEQTIQATQYGLSKRGNPKGQYPILRMNNLNGGKLYTRDLQFVDLDTKEFQKFRLNHGDVLFNRTNSFELVGKTSIFDLDSDFVFASYLVRVIPKNDSLNSAYLNYYLNMDSSQKRLKLLASRGVSQSNINATKLRGFHIPLPPLPTQKQIAQILSSLDAKIQAEEDKKQALETLFKTLLEHLMTGKIHVTHLEIPS